MFLKNDKYIFYFLLTITFIFSSNVYSKTNDKKEVFNYLNSLKNFSASFLQNDGKDLSEGKVYIGTKRVRAEYFSPSKILIILDEDKAMYYNYELEEDEFFNPKNTSAWFFYDIFRNPYFFKDSKFDIKQNEIIVEKNGFDNEQQEYQIKVYFENNPLMLRKIEVSINKDFLELSIFNHNYNEDFASNFFKLINPNLIN